jgi:hypothetical protein
MTIFDVIALNRNRAFCVVSMTLIKSTPVWIVLTKLEQSNPR